MWIFLLLLFGFVHGKSENEIFRLKTDSWLELKEGFLQPKVRGNGSFMPLVIILARIYTCGYYLQEIHTPNNATTQYNNTIQ